MKINQRVFIEKEVMIESPEKISQIRLTTDQCIIDGRCMNYDNLLTTNEISRRVRDKYYKEPST